MNRKQSLVFFVTLSSILYAILLYSPFVLAQEQLPRGDFVDLRETGKAEVIDIVNPMTVLLSDGRIARLSGIDIPSYTGDEISPWAVTARDILRDFLQSQRVVIYQTKTRDKGRMNRMGHELLHVVRDDNGAWIQGLLLSLGLAQVKTTQYTPEMALQMYTIEDKARNDRIGLWEDESYRVLSPEETQSHIGTFAIVEGEVKSVSLKQNRIYMNFGGNWRSDFTVSVAPEDKRVFSKAGIDLLGWGGKYIQVRGTLQSINGPYIEINHPQAIRLLKKESVESLPEAP